MIKFDRCIFLKVLLIFLYKYFLYYSCILQNDVSLALRVHGWEKAAQALSVREIAEAHSYGSDQTVINDQGSGRGPPRLFCLIS